MIPRIHGLCVCVGYSHFLALSGATWRRGLASLTIVTTPTDRTTHKIAQMLADRSQIPISLYKTDVFTTRGASFNKGAAMEEARQTMPWEDWILFFDVDIVPESNWEEKLGTLQLGYLYGAPRHSVETVGDICNPNRPIVPDDRIGYGYFQLFHAHDPKVQKTPLLDTFWRHAGNADSNFLLSFGPYVRDAGIDLWHIGPTHENWFGMGRTEEFRRMQATRGGQGIHPSERIDG